MKFPDPKVGDPVAVRASRAEPRRTEIIRVTATQVVVTGNRRFGRATGREVGAGYDSAWAEPWTDETDRRLAALRAAVVLEDRRQALRKRFDEAATPLWLSPDARLRRRRSRPCGWTCWRGQPSWTTCMVAYGWTLAEAIRDLLRAIATDDDARSRDSLPPRGADPLWWHGRHPQRDYRHARRIAEDVGLWRPYVVAMVIGVCSHPAQATWTAAEVEEAIARDVRIRAIDRVITESDALRANRV